MGYRKEYVEKNMIFSLDQIVEMREVSLNLRADGFPDGTPILDDLSTSLNNASLALAIFSLAFNVTSFIEWPAPSKLNYTIPNFPSIYNQKWTGMNSDWIKNYGCALCCAACVATFYKGSEVDPRNLSYDPEAGIYWGSMPNAYYTDAVPSLITLKAQIALNKPVVIHVKGDLEHWVVAYGYEGDGASYSLIKVKDSAGAVGSTQYGINRNLAESIIYNKCKAVIGFKLTSKKS